MLVDQEKIEAMFPGCDVEPKWCLADSIHTGPLFAMYLLLGARVVSSPHARTTHTSIITAGKEFVLTNEDYEFSRKLAESYVVGYLDRHAFNFNEQPELIKYFSACPQAIVQAIQWMQDDAFATYDVNEHRCKAFWTFPDEGACGYYRSYRPQKYMNDEFKDDFHSELSAYINYKSLTYYDAVFYNRIPTHHTMAMMQNLALENKVMVWETDDDLLNIPDWSISKLLVPQDMKDLFIASRDLANIIYTTNETLRQQIGKPEITYVAPNLIDMDRFTSLIGKQKPLQKKFAGYRPRRIRGTLTDTPKFVNSKGHIMDELTEKEMNDERKPIIILWSGSNTHDADLEQVIPAVKIIGEKYGIAVRFIFFGYVPSSIAEVGMLPGNSAPQLRVHQDYADFVEYIGSVKLNDYPEMLRRICPDISLCPLWPHPFNECKSNLKPLELGAMGVPSIVSDFGPYKFIKHKFDGYKVEHSEDKNVLTARWAAAIEHLINNKQEREFIGANIQNRVREEYSWQTDSENRRLWDKLFAAVKEEIKIRKEKNLLRTGPMLPLTDISRNAAGRI